VVTILFKTTVKAHIVEAIIAILIAVFSAAAVFVASVALTSQQGIELMFSVILILFIMLFVGLLSLILVLVKIWEKLDERK
jgi:hypothetical protein